MGETRRTGAPQTTPIVRPCGVHAGHSGSQSCSNSQLMNNPVLEDIIKDKNLPRDNNQQSNKKGAVWTITGEDLTVREEVDFYSY